MDFKLNRWVLNVYYKKILLQIMDHTKVVISATNLVLTNLMNLSFVCDRNRRLYKQASVKRVSR